MLAKSPWAPRRRFARTLLAGATLAGAVLIAAPASAASTAWQPVASEKLIQLPAGYMEKAIEKDFRDSPLASQLSAADSEAARQAKRMTQLNQQIGESQGADNIELRHQFLAAKSAYLDAVEQQQSLEKQALATRAKIYQQVLDTMNKDRRRAQDPVGREVLVQQQRARERMERATALVDNLMMAQNHQQKSGYNSEYATNLDKINQLREAISRHAANRSAGIDGQPVDRDQYLRQLLNDVNAEQALLAQESQMLSYMAQLVALDAQALEMELTLNELDEGDAAAADSGSLSSTASLFIN